MLSVTHVMTFSITQWVTFSITQWVTLSITPRTTHDLQMKKPLASPTTYERLSTCGQPGSEGLEPSTGDLLGKARVSAFGGQGRRTEHGAGKSVTSPSNIISRQADRPGHAGVGTPRADPIGHGSSLGANRSHEHSTDVRETSTHDLSRGRFLPIGSHPESPRPFPHLSPRNGRRRNCSPTLARRLRERRAPESRRFTLERTAY